MGQNTGLQTHDHPDSLFPLIPLIITCYFPGLSTWLVNRLVSLRELPVWAINFIISVTTTTVTEVVSNTATANILLPILKEMSLTLCQNPTYLGQDTQEVYE